MRGRHKTSTAALLRSFLQTACSPFLYRNNTRKEHAGYERTASSIGARRDSGARQEKRILSSYPSLGRRQEK